MSSSGEMREVIVVRAKIPAERGTRVSFGTKGGRTTFNR